MLDGGIARQRRFEDLDFVVHGECMPLHCSIIGSASLQLMPLSQQVGRSNARPKMPSLRYKIQYYIALSQFDLPRFLTVSFPAPFSTRISGLDQQLLPSIFLLQCILRRRGERMQAIDQGHTLVAFLPDYTADACQISQPGQVLNTSTNHII